MNIFTFTIVIMSAYYYVEISRVGKLEAEFHQALLVKISDFFYSIVRKHQAFKISRQFKKYIFLGKN